MAFTHKYKEISVIFRTVFGLLLLTLSSCAITPQPIVKGVIERYPSSIDEQSGGLYSAKVVSKKLSDTLWSYEEKGITIRFIPDKLLNIYEGNPHTLYVGIFQLNNPSKFIKMSSTQSGIEELLSDEVVDDSILSNTKQILYPDIESIVVLDRAEQSKYIAIVTGYVNLESDSSVRIIPINGMQEPRKNLLSFIGEPDIRAAIVKLWVSLGEKSIKSVELRSQ